MTRCPHCHQPMPEPKKRTRVCFDCRKPIRAHDKWCWVERQGIQTSAHRHCDNPESYNPKGQDPVAPAPLFDGAQA